MSDNEVNHDALKRTIVDPDPERERGVLTPHDRSFLRAFDSDEGVREEMSKTAERQKRHKIRQRFRNALLDLQYMLLLDGEDMSRVFGDEFGDHDREKVERIVFEAIYHFIRSQSDRERFFGLLDEQIKREITRERAIEHHVYTPVTIEREVDIPPVDECPSLDEISRRERDPDDQVPAEAIGALAAAEVPPWDVPREEDRDHGADDHGEK